MLGYIVFVVYFVPIEIKDSYIKELGYRACTACLFFYGFFSI